MNAASIAADRVPPRMRNLSLLGGAFALFNGLRIAAIAASIAWLRWVQPHASFPSWF